jgi:hypothetical protein
MKLTKNILSGYGGICFLTVLILSSLLHAHPGWVKTGVVAYYEGIGAFKKGGEYNSGVKMDIVDQVDSANNGDIVVTATFTEPTSGYTYTNTSSYGPTDVVGAFWADDRALQNAKNGDKIGIFNVTKGPFQDRINGKIWNAVMLEVKDKVEVRMVFDERTGLLLHYAEVYPNQETYIDIKSISVDLSGYTTPPGAGGIKPNSDGVGGPQDYGKNGSSQNDTTSPLGAYQKDYVNSCGGIFFILAGVSLALVVR